MTVYTCLFCVERSSMRLSKRAEKEVGGCNDCLGSDQTCCIDVEIKSYAVDVCPAVTMLTDMSKSKYMH